MQRQVRKNLVSLCVVSLLGAYFPAVIPLTCIPAVDSFKLINQAREQKAQPDIWPANRKPGATLCYLVPFYLSPCCRKWTSTLQKNNEWSWCIKVKQAWQVLKKKAGKKIFKKPPTKKNPNPPRTPYLLSKSNQYSQHSLKKWLM